MTAVTINLAPARRWLTRSAVARLDLRALIGLVVLSRLLVLAAGAAGQQWGGKPLGWRSIDVSGVSQSFGQVGNLLLASGVRWDAIGYLSIASHGYAHAGNTVFYPGYPVAVAALGWVIGSNALAGVLISTACFGIALWLLHRLTAQELGGRAADAAILLLAFAPLSFFFSAVYTESLFLALSVGAMYAARRERWWLAGLLAGLAAVTRITGVLLAVPLLLWQARRYRRPHPQMAWALLPPAALVGYAAYLNGKGYGWLAPFHNEQSARHFGGPWSTVFDALKGAEHGVGQLLTGNPPVDPSIAGPFSSGFESIVLLLVLGVAVAALVGVFRRLPIEYGALALLTLLIDIATDAKIQPLYSDDRYMLTIFPLWMAAGAWLYERRLLRTTLLIGAALLAFYSFEFATWAFVA